MLYQCKINGSSPRRTLHLFIRRFNVIRETRNETPLQKFFEPNFICITATTAVAVSALY